MTRLIDDVQPKQARAQATRQRLLDAAVDELVEHGYVEVTTHGVAARAGVSRGAQQNYFPRKTVLVAAAVRELARRQLTALRVQLKHVPEGRERVAAGLDVLFRQYSGPLFATIVELSLAARDDPELRHVVQEEEHNITSTLHDTAIAIFGNAVPRTELQTNRWRLALSAIRGVAMLKLLGHASTTVDRQWRVTREQLLELLLGPSE